jgi:hypothetical protein
VCYNKGTKRKEWIEMLYVVTKYQYGMPILYYCRTIEKAKELFARIFWEWVEEEISSPWPANPSDYSDCETWEEMLALAWEVMGCDDVVHCTTIEFEEDKIGG